MKKLMIAASAALCATVGFGELASANVVGYQEKSVTSGNQTAGVTFVNIDKDGTMADLKVTGYEGEYNPGDLYCGKLDGYGRTITRMYWSDLAEYDDGTTVWPAAYGWWNIDATEEYNAEPLEAGEGLWLTMPNNTLKLQCSGEVLNESLPVNLVSGNQLLANPTPSTLKMGEIWVTGYTGEYNPGDLYCGKLDPYGRTITRMYWSDLAEFDDGTTVWPAAYGWWNIDATEEYNDTESLGAGEALWLTSPNATLTLNWPNPLATE